MLAGMSDAAKTKPENRALLPALHFVGFRDERYWNAVRIWGKPDFIHITYDRYAVQDMAPWDVVVFAKGDWQQEPRPFSGPGLIEV